MMLSETEEPVPYPLLGLGVALLLWPLAFSGQWDPLLLIGTGGLVGLGFVLLILRQYAFGWSVMLLWPFLLIGWVVVASIMNSAARDLAWVEVFWWTIGGLVLFFSAMLGQRRTYRRWVFTAVVVAEVALAIASIILWLKTPTQRLSGLQFNANAYAGVALWGFVPLAVLAGRRWRHRRLAFIGLAVVAIAFALTISLTAGIATVATGLVALWLERKSVSRRIIFRLGLALAVGVLTAVGLWTVPKIRTMMDAEHIRFSFSQRADFSRAAFRMGVDRPLSGWGPGSFQIIYPRYSTQPNEQPRYPHNLAAQLFAETGWPGMLLWLVVLVMIGRTGWRVTVESEDHERPLLRGFWYAWLAFSLLSFVDFSWQFPAGQLIWWAVSGLFLGQSIRPSAVTRLPAQARLLIAVVAIGILAWTGRFAMSHVEAQAAAKAEANDDTTAQIKAWEGSLAWQPNRTASIELLRTLWLRRSEGDLEQADHLLRLLAERNQEDYAVAYWQGLVARARGEDDKALAAFGRAYERDPIFHLEHAVEYAKELGKAGDRTAQEQVIADTLDRYVVWRRFNQNTIEGQLEALRQMRP